MKWAIVLAGVSDFFRPPEKLSLTQNLALTATGSIWTRWCFVIKPQNYLCVHLLFPVYPFSFLSCSLAYFPQPCRSSSTSVVRGYELTNFHWRIFSDRLAAVNFCLAIVGTLQVSRILVYRSSVEGSTGQAMEASKEEERSAAKGVKEDVKKAVA